MKRFWAFMKEIRWLITFPKTVLKSFLTLYCQSQQNGAASETGEGRLLFHPGSDCLKQLLFNIKKAKKNGNQ